MTHAYLDALDTLAESRPMLDPNNYSTMASYRADQRANMRDLADYRLLRLYVAPTAEALAYAARGTRLSFRTTFDSGVVVADYTAGQYYPREYRAACVRLLASLWWHMQAEAFHDPEWTADDIRKHARRVFGRGIASRWFN